jgi:hypothetical protein
MTRNCATPRDFTPIGYRILGNCRPDMGPDGSTSPQGIAGAMKKLPPHGKPIDRRLRFRNDPLHVVVCVGLDCWERAKEWNTCPNDCPAMVLPDGDSPGGYTWPVSHQLVVVDVACGPSDEQVRELAVVLIHHGAESVTVVSRDGLNAFRQYIPCTDEAAA